jgi:hypothetical protein
MKITAFFLINSESGGNTEDVTIDIDEYNKSLRKSVMYAFRYVQFI